MVRFRSTQPGPGQRLLPTTPAPHAAHSTQRLPPLHSHGGEASLLVCLRYHLQKPLTSLRFFPVPFLLQKKGGIDSARRVPFISRSLPAPALQ